MIRKFFAMDPLCRTSKQEDLLEQMQNLISANLCDHEFDMDKLAHQLKISQSKLYSVIKSAYQESPGRHLLRRRLDAAMELLHDYNLNISQIAYKVGFKNTSFFSSSFKSRFGKTPKEVMSDFINART